MYFGDGMTMEVWETALSHPGAGPGGWGAPRAGAEGS